MLLEMIESFGMAILSTLLCHRVWADMQVQPISKTASNDEKGSKA